MTQVEMLVCKQYEGFNFVAQQRLIYLVFMGCWSVATLFDLGSTWFDILLAKCTNWKHSHEKHPSLWVPNAFL